MDMVVSFAGLSRSVFLIFYLAVIAVAKDILIPKMEIKDGLTLVSAGNHFEFGFFTIANSTFLGIWYYNITPQKIVWVANRNTPLTNTSGMVRIVEDGNAILQGNAGRILWSTNVQDKSAQGTVLQLLDSGNLVLRHDDNGNAESYLWESFDLPSDTWLPGMKIGKDPRTGLNRNITSWKSTYDPSPGEFTYGIRPQAPLLEILLCQGNSVQFRTGPWNGVGFSGIGYKPSPLFNIKLIVNQEEIHYEMRDSIITMSTLSYTGEIQRYVWNSSSLQWLIIKAVPKDPCEHYGQCGPNSICTITDQYICSCLTGYIPKSPQDWELQAWSSGCIRKEPLNCSKGEGFMEEKGVKVPDHWNYLMKTSISLQECEAECLKNCSCTAYTNSNVSGRGSGCLLWYGDLFDIRRLTTTGNQNLYIRVAAVDLGSKKKKRKVLLVVVTISTALALLFLACSIILIKRTKGQALESISGAAAGIKPKPQPKGMDDLEELPTFEMISIAEATNQFSVSNKIGEGGFGSVYKGHLETGQKIAVKRLSINSNQGLDEFKNEVIFISKLQHRNLVRLLGCCIHGDERMLIYEYMPNESLNNYIYDSTRRDLLNWKKRFDIITGIARGLLYLHRDSRLRVIHRDLKASNILLDSEMNPKISDFGIARAFSGEQIMAKTTRVIGTYGYMAPEYVINGVYSMKSDVFSFGVLILEIVSGKRNTNFNRLNDNVTLLGHAWKLWTEGKAYKLIDDEMEEPFPISEVERCIQVGLLCVQQQPNDRPTMSTVLLMLDSETAILPQPKPPGFYTEMITDDSSNQLNETPGSTNAVTITLLGGR